jgi:ketosteroid isomerase-like protein
MAPNLESMIGKEAIHTFATSFPDIQVKFNTVEITGSAHYAYVGGTFVISDSTGTILDKGKYASLWEKSADDVWQITRDIFNSDLPVMTISKEAEPRK